MPSELRSAIKARGVLVGTIITTSSPELVEALSLSGLDWLFFDLEHSVPGIQDVQHMLMALRKPCLSLLRIECADQVFVKRALDTGCDGIIVPQVNSPDTARQVVAAAKYSPLGTRGVGANRSSGYGYSLASAVASDNERTAVIVQIEHIQAVEHIESILAVEGIDAIFVGPNDLSSSMGRPGEVQHPMVQRAIDKVARAARDAAMPAGIYVADDTALELEVKKGFQFFAVGTEIARAVASCRGTLSARDRLCSRR